MKASEAPEAPLPRSFLDPWLATWDEFDGALAAARKSPNTRRAYRDAGDQFREFLIRIGHDVDPASVGRREVAEFLAGLHADGAAAATVRARYSALRRLFRWLVKEGLLERSPMEAMESPQVPEVVTEFVTDAEVKAMLRACEGRALEDRRDAAILLLMYDAGLRRGAVVSMTLEDTDVRGNVAVVRTKGDRTLMVPFGAATAEALARYLRLRSKHWAANRVREDGRHPLWLAQKGWLSSDGVHHLVHRRAGLAGIKRAIWPHMFRHAFADRWLAAEGTEGGLMRVGGWRDPKVMRRYGSAMPDTRARAEHARVSPADRLLGGSS